MHIELQSVSGEESLVFELPFFFKEIFLLKNKTDRKILIIQNSLFGSYILENEWSELSFQEK